MSPRSSEATLEDGRQHQLVDRADLHRNDAKDEPDRAPLLEHVAAKPTESRNAIGEVDLLRVPELLALRGRHDRGAHRDEILVVETFVGRGGLEGPPDPHHRIAADLEVEVRRPVVHGDFQEIVDVHDENRRSDYRRKRRRAAGCDVKFEA